MQNLIPTTPLGNLTRIEFKGQPVLTTAQLAEFYETNADNIKRNFSNNRERFIEGKHYFKVEGDDLEFLRGKNFHLQISPKTRTLYLWTKKGCARHCKSVGTNQAWDVFEALEDNYFNHFVSKDLPPITVDNFERAAAMRKLACHSKDPYKREKLVAEAANLLFGREEFTAPNFQPVEQLSLFYMK